MPDEPRIYRLDPAEFAAVRREILTQLAASAPFVIGGVWLLDGFRAPKRDLFDFLFLPLILLFVYRLIARENVNWNSLVLEQYADRLVRTLPDFPPLEIALKEVTSITESPKGLTIKTNSRQKSLFVSSALFEYTSLRGWLVAAAPTTKLLSARWCWPAFLLRILLCLALAFGLFGTPLYVIYSPHRALAIALGLASFVAVLVLILYTRNSPYLPISARNRGWILLVIPVGALISRMWH